MSRAPAITIERLPADELRQLEPLWNALREHHGSIAPDYGPLRPRDASWEVRRHKYEAWLADPGAFVLVALAETKLVGYAVVAIHGPSATWPIERSGCLETLAVLPDSRGAGVGSALISRVRSGLHAAGIDTLSLMVIHGNDRAAAFYRRHGFAAMSHVIWGQTATP